MKRRRKRQQQERPFAGLRGQQESSLQPGGQLAAIGVPATLLDDARCAAFAVGNEHLVPCGDASVDRFDGRLLLDNVSRWVGDGRTQQQQQQQQQQPGNGDVDEATLDAERYRHLDLSKAHLLASGLPLDDGGGSNEDEDDEGAWSVWLLGCGVKAAVALLCSAALLLPPPPRCLRQHPR